MLSLTIFMEDRDKNKVSQMFLCDCVQVNSLSQIIVYFTDGKMTIDGEAYIEYIVYPHAAGDSSILFPNNPSKMSKV